MLSEFLVEGIDLTTGSAKGDPHIAVRFDPDWAIFPMLWRWEWLATDSQAR